MIYAEIGWLSSARIGLEINVYCFKGELVIHAYRPYIMSQVVFWQCRSFYSTDKNCHWIIALLVRFSVCGFGSNETVQNKYLVYFHPWKRVNFPGKKCEQQFLCIISSAKNLLKLEKIIAHIYMHASHIFVLFIGVYQNIKAPSNTYFQKIVVCTISPGTICDCC